MFFACKRKKKTNKIRDIFSYSLILTVSLYMLKLLKEKYQIKHKSSYIILLFFFMALNFTDTDNPELLWAKVSRIIEVRCVNVWQVAV